MKRLESVEAIRYVTEALSDTVVDVLLEPLARHHFPTYEHSLHVAFIATQICMQCDFCEKDVKTIAIGALLHDVGKMHIPNDLLDKVEPLSEDDFRLLHEHSETGYATLKNLGIPAEICNIALLHHYKKNRTGYPLKSDDRTVKKLLSEESTPSELVKIVTVADIYEAVVTPRAYKEKYSIDKAIRVLDTGVLTGELESKYVSALKRLIDGNRLLLQAI